MHDRESLRPSDRFRFERPRPRSNLPKPRSCQKHDGGHERCDSDDGRPCDNHDDGANCEGRGDQDHAHDPRSRGASEAPSTRDTSHDELSACNADQTKESRDCGHRAQGKRGASHRGESQSNNGKDREQEQSGLPGMTDCLAPVCDPAQLHSCLVSFRLRTLRLLRLLQMFLDVPVLEISGSSAHEHRSSQANRPSARHKSLEGEEAR